MATIKEIAGRKILNSRGDWTIEVKLALSNGSMVKASVPEGKSKGSAEAAVVEPEKAVKILKTIIAGKYKGAPTGNQKTIDKKLIELDGTVNKNKLGGNTLLCFSIAYARASAFAAGIPLWKYLRQISTIVAYPTHKPQLFINLINGGAHSDNGLDFQEYLLIPQTKSFHEATGIGTRIYHALKKYLRQKYGPGATGIGDEGGFAPVVESNTKPFEILEKIVKDLKLLKKVRFGMDAAATGIKLSNHELFDFYSKIAKRFNLQYLEDPFSENDFENFAIVRKKIGKEIWLAGDDLTTTNLSRMQQAHDNVSVNAMIIKPNQIATVTETLSAVKQAKKWGWKVIVSHRSGETNDDFIADLAFGVGADGIKLGAPARGERTAKYNRLLEIENEA